MKLQCGILPIIIALFLGLGGGFAIGKMTQPITINNNSESTSISSANSIAVSGSILINNDRRSDYINVNIQGITNVQVTTVSNGVTNNIKK